MNTIQIKRTNSSSKVSSTSLESGELFVDLEKGDLYCGIDGSTTKKLLNQGSKIHYATCSTAAATAAKVATLNTASTFTLETGTIVSVKFTNGNTAASPTLNVGNTGAKVIYTRDVRYVYWQESVMVVFVYDGSYWHIANEPAYANEIYTCDIISDNGIVFKNDTGTTTLTASVRDTTKDVTDTLTLKWYKNGTELTTGKTLTVNASDVNIKAVYKVEAANTEGTCKAMAEVTITKIRDGEDAILLQIDSSNGDSFKNSNISTTMTVVIIMGDTRIETSSKMKETFGDEAYLTWKCKPIGSEEWVTIPDTDTRLSDNGFIFTINPQDVDTKAVFQCELNF